MSQFAGAFRPNAPSQAQGSPLRDDWLRPDFESWRFGPVAFQWRSSPVGRRLFAYDANTGLAVVGDVRLDNRLELHHALGRSVSGDDDIDYVLAAYTRWGEDSPKHLLGDFAFLVWDPRLQTLFAARDHFGVMPFYYTSSALGVFMGNHSTLLRTSDPRTIRASAIVEYIAGYPPSLPETPYRDVFRLAPAFTCTAGQDGRLRLQRYYQLAASHIGAQNPAEEFRAIFEEAVRCRLAGGVNVGAMLSGGLDSSSIVAVGAPIWRALSGADLPTISKVFDQTPQWNERTFIEAVTALGSVSPTFLASDEADPFSEVDQIIAEQDGPFLGLGLTMSRSVYRSAAASNVPVLLDGHGGDEVVSHGGARLGELARSMRWLELWRQSKALGGDDHGTPRQVFIRSLSHHPGARALLKSVRQLRAVGRPAAVQSWRPLAYLNPDFLSALNYKPDSLADRGTPWRTEQESHRLVLLDDLQCYALEGLHHNADALGVEARYPFWDKRLVEFCLGLDGRHKLDDGWTRLILRQALDGVLPPAVQWRRDKLNFAPHIVRGLLKHSEAIIDGVIEGNGGDIGNFINLIELRRAYARVLALKEEASGFDIQIVIRAVILSRWLSATNALVAV